MKKHFYSFLIWLGCALVFTNTLHAAENKATLPVKKEKTAVSLPRAPHTDIEISVRDVVNSPVNHVIKKVWEDNGRSDIKESADCRHYFSPCNDLLNSLYSKRYLSHIHPSHYFW